MTSMIHDPVAELLTERLRIRRITQQDAPSFFAIFSNADVMRYWSSPALTDLGQAQEKIASILEHYQSGDLFQFGIERKSDRQLIGTSTLHQIHAQNRRAEIGYALGRDHWGQGYMQEALTALINHAFGAMALHRLEADIDPRNEGSAKSLERMGFTREGYLRERWIVGGEVSDSALYGLLAREWLARRKAA
ncbi:MAG: GNAT family N-acetyltransferase [Betaproteobacteria bacterium]|nr:GNAT family N-acetyltransferase [Betaproteobacteria bacterium]